MEKDFEQMSDGFRDENFGTNDTSSVGPDAERPVRQRRPRVRIHRAEPVRPQQSEAGSFRPEGFGSAFSQNDYRPARPRYERPYDEERPARYGQPRDNRYQPREGGYQPRANYRPRYQQHADGQDDYQPRENRFQPREGGYQPREGGYQRREGGYQPRPYRPRQQYGQRDGQYRPHGQRDGYQPRRPHSADYDPNAKYSMKKRIEYREEHYDPSEPIRLNKYLANAGVCSRREADEFIQQGAVTVNGEVMTEMGTKVLRTDDVRLNGQPVMLEKKVYVLLNKPKDCVTTLDDPQQRKTVLDLVRNACPERIYPVGRLDRNTTGVLLLTNDGELASKLTHPKFLKKKVYHVFLDRGLTQHDLQQIAEGITLDDGEIHADAIEYTDENDRTQVGIEIHSGKNRIVRRIFESLGYRVLKLDRVLFAGLTKKNLRRGDWRFLTQQEVEMLRMGAFE